MIYVKVSDGSVVEFSERIPEDYSNPQWKSRWDFDTLSIAEDYAAQLSVITGDVYISTDSGECVSPRFDIIKAPKVGDLVSYGFNGDSYPDGEIIKMTKKMTVYTSNGHVYRRRKLSGSWVRTGGTWCLIPGHISEQNPHF